MYSINETSAAAVPTPCAPPAQTAQNMPASAFFSVDSHNIPLRLQPETLAFLHSLDTTKNATRLPPWLEEALDKFRANRLLNAAFLVKTTFRGTPTICKVELIAKIPARRDTDTLIRLTALRGSDLEALGAHAANAALSPDLCRMESLKVAGELAAGVSHEIRNPMTSVRGFLQMLRRKKALQEYHAYFNLMIEELDRANSLITEYLSLAKDKPQPTQSKNLCGIIQKIQPLLEASALMSKKALRLSLDPVPNLPLNDKEICQLIVNLAKNGLEAMEIGKTLTIGTRKDNDSVVLFVKDEGSGIPPAALEKIGEPFFTTKESGTGLGLPICYSLAKHNHAKIQVASSSEGTTFSVVFSLPLEADSHA